MCWFLYVDDGDRPFVAFGSIEGVVLLEDINEGVLPFRDVVHEGSLV